MRNNIKYGLLGLLGAFLTLTLYHAIFGVTVRPKTTSDFAKTSVMITRYDGRSGGSGVIFSSSRNESKILTNKHVCEVVKFGGIVRSDDKKAMVKYYQESNVHDLCLITVNANFKINTVLARQEPEIYDDAIVSGHPRLLPNILTQGHFSGKELISVMIGMRPCTPLEQTDPNTSFFCDVVGGFPVIKTYEAQVVSATIQPGSSGSAVFNKDGELSGLIFAGSGDFGFGHIVPYEYIVSFFDIELPHLLQTLPLQSGEPELSVAKVDWKRICSQGFRDKKFTDTCELVSKSLLLGK